MGRSLCHTIGLSGGGKDRPFNCHHNRLRLAYEFLRLASRPAAVYTSLAADGLQTLRWLTAVARGLGKATGTRTKA